jgi:hypothetical protein
VVDDKGSFSNSRDLFLVLCRTQHQIGMHVINEMLKPVLGVGWIKRDKGSGTSGSQQFPNQGSFKSKRSKSCYVNKIPAEKEKK